MGFWNTLSKYLTSIPQVTGSFEFYREHILKGDSLLAPLCERYKFKSHIPPWKWELFAAILVDDVSKKGYGSDLLHHEVKSAKSSSGFEYQYHAKSWEAKLEREAQIEHIYIWYEPGYRNIVVWSVPGAKFAEIFNSWKPDIEKAYSGEPDQRCRKYISSKTIKENGQRIFEIENGKLKFYEQSYFPRLLPDPQKPL